MSNPLRVDLFVEDIAHEKLLAGLVRRAAREEGTIARCQIRSARGGHAKALGEFRLHQRLLAEGTISGVPDLLVVAIDSNCSTFTATRSEIEKATRDEFKHLTVAACPDPHIERWYMADPNSFNEIVGHRPALGQSKCERGYYKHILHTAVQAGGHPAMLGGIEFAQDLVEVMDLYRAGRGNPSLKAFLDDLRPALRRLARTKRRPG